MTQSRRRLNRLRGNSSRAVDAGIRHYDLRHIFCGDRPTWHSPDLHGLDRKKECRDPTTNCSSRRPSCWPDFDRVCVRRRYCFSLSGHIAPGVSNCRRPSGLRTATEAEEDEAEQSTDVAGFPLAVPLCRSGRNDLRHSYYGKGRQRFPDSAYRNVYPPLCVAALPIGLPFCIATDGRARIDGRQCHRARFWDRSIYARRVCRLYCNSETI